MPWVPLSSHIVVRPSKKSKGRAQQTKAKRAQARRRR